MNINEINHDKNVCIVGLGYVGLTLAVAMADAGFNVYGVEVREAIVKELLNGRTTIHEPGLESKLTRLITAGKLFVSQEIPEQQLINVYIITVGTPLNDLGISRVDMIERVSNEVSAKMLGGELIILRSTVKIGVTRNVVLPILEKAKKKFDLAFCPERTLEGKALTELNSLPQIVGGLNYSAQVRACQLFHFLTPTVVKVSDLETAEMIKLVDNAQRDVSFAYANEVAKSCDAVGISASEVIRSGKLGYPRTNLPMPGLVGGPCLEKDSHIFAEGLRERGFTPTITIAARTLNETQPYDIVEYIKNFSKHYKSFSTRPKIALLGLAFKGIPQTDDLRGTMARPVLNALKEKFSNAIFYGYDEIVDKKEIVNFGLNCALTLEDAFYSSSLVIILNNHPSFEDMDLNRFGKTMQKPSFIYDFWNFYESKSIILPEGVGYVAIGSHGKAKLP